ncbi:DUF2249 domain-containing protein [Chitinimonas taiwanensis]|jgi:uncharacterized protein (DUF2249 family)|uniref:Uncharacterized conserved protein, DUF2249 family n=1 Tax=Chitinimonas taiwanensis DSM 18899 TaxID=1121279 RepID=A0A1K2H9B9_9NEIS|nr:DUF2249 domain-containing protein [Chitinimonas taiwanensis]SFZ73398.1 Uncharacterized conserved protein, DUF2249 family [Chitinimonas taiwanensis DSM 18899]
MNGIISDNTFVFDARGVAKRFRHAAIFGALEALREGEVMRFINDHEPLPLLQQIGQRYREQVRIHYVDHNPEQVVIDFSVHPLNHSEAAAGGGCGSGQGSGCGCSGG